MRVLIFNEKTAMKGGIDVMVENEVRGLLNRGIETKLVEISHNEFNQSNWLKRVKQFAYTIRLNNLPHILLSEINTFKPDIVHFHNTYQLYRQPIWKYLNNRVKIIQHLHNYYPFCLNSFFFTRGEICTKCLEKDSWKPGIYLKCYNNSLFKSFLVSTNRELPARWLKLGNKVDKFIAVSESVKKTYLGAGVEEERIEVIPNFIRFEPDNNYINGEYILFLGNFVEAKGIREFCKAAVENQDLQFVATGTGEDYERIRKEFHTLSNLKFTGYLQGDEKKEIIRRSRFLYLPNKWWEPFGLVVLEGFSNGKPILTRDMGGLKELVIPGVTGEFLEEGMLRYKLKQMWDETSSGNNKYYNGCIRKFQEFSEENHINQLIKLYEKLSTI